MNQLIADYTFMQNTTWRLKAQYPMLQVKTIGKSVVGRSIYGLEIGRESAPCTLFVGTLWGTDNQSGPLLLQFAESLLKGIANGSSVSGVNPLTILSKQKIVLIPFANPDGREICARGAHCAGLDSGRIRRLCHSHTAKWSANARGVDIGRNFDFGFAPRRKREQGCGIFGPAAFGYSGPTAESEPETVAIADYCRQQKTIHTVAFYPGSGEVYWRNNREESEHNRQAGQLIALAAGYATEAEFGALTDSGFRNWSAAALNCPSVDIMFRSSVEGYTLYQELAELLVTACLVHQ
ncbi:MAG: hypothetical protein IJP35_08440 [Clostridia bacterium]|nr:hypothetical protein [Clostridia bacterium]